MRLPLRHLPIRCGRRGRIPLPVFLPILIALRNILRLLLLLLFLLIGYNQPRTPPIKAETMK